MKRKVLSLALALLLAAAWIPTAALAADPITLEDESCTIEISQPTLGTTPDLPVDLLNMAREVAYQVPVGTVVTGEGVVLTDLYRAADKTRIMGEEYERVVAATGASVPDEDFPCAPFTVVTEDYYMVRREAAAGIIVLKGVNTGAESPDAAPAPSVAKQLMALPSTQTVTVDGAAVEFAMYALMNEAGNLTNYIRLRDLAAILNGTAAQFDVGWNGNVTVTSQSPYTGSTDSVPFHTGMACAEYADPTYVDGAPADLHGIQITYNGGGYTYFELRSLGACLDFNVGWSAEQGVFVETDKPYTTAD